MCVYKHTYKSSFYVAKWTKPPCHIKNTNMVVLIQRPFSLMALNKKTYVLIIVVIIAVVWLWFRCIANGSQLQWLHGHTIAIYNLQGWLPKSKVNGETARRLQMEITWHRAKQPHGVHLTATRTAMSAVIGQQNHVILCFMIVSLSSGIDGPKYHCLARTTCKSLCWISIWGIRSATTSDVFNIILREECYTSGLGKSSKQCLALMTLQAKHPFKVIL